MAMITTIPTSTDMATTTTIPTSTSTAIPILRRTGMDTMGR